MPHTLYPSFRTQRKRVSVCDSFLNPLSFSSSQLWKIGSLIVLFPQAYQVNHVHISVSQIHSIGLMTGVPENQEMSLVWMLVAFRCPSLLLNWQPLLPGECTSAGSLFEGKAVTDAAKLSNFWNELWFENSVHKRL